MPKICAMCLSMMVCLRSPRGIVQVWLGRILIGEGLRMAKSKCMFHKDGIVLDEK